MASQPRLHDEYIQVSSTEEDSEQNKDKESNEQWQQSTRSEGTICHVPYVHTFCVVCLMFVHLWSRIQNL